MPDQNHDLPSFAIALADELPGAWTSTVTAHPLSAGQATAAEGVWDMNLVADALARHRVDQSAVLAREDGTRLFVIARPGEPEEYLAAVMAPAGLPAEAFGGVREPDGIAVPDQPSDAAHQIAADLLPRYESAMVQVRANAGVRTESVTMTWLADGLLAATTTAPGSAAVLAETGFTYHPDEETFLLDGDDTAEQARRVRAAGARLADLGIGVIMRRTPSPTSLDTATTVPRSAQPARSAARAR